MTVEQATTILAVITAAYPNAYKNLSAQEAKAVAVVWAVQFNDTPADIVFMAVNKAIASSKFPPTIAEVKDKIRALYWEAYEAIRTNESLGLPADSVKDYKRIYELTQGAKYKTEEPTITDMLASSKRYMLTDGDNAEVL